MKKGKMKYISLILITILTACSSNYVEKKTIINDNSDLLKLNAEICNKYKSDESKTYGCGSGLSSDLEVSKTKSLLNAKVNVADVVGSSILKSEKQTRTENTKGVNSKYQTIEENKILETSLNNYKVVFTKTFKQGNKFRTYTVIKYATKT
tara:strand:+ start:608 stop:1060 length:453 start_codon:yes stop_codon:yes gene_type:complete